MLNNRVTDWMFLILPLRLCVSIGYYTATHQQSCAPKQHSFFCKVVPHLLALFWCSRCMSSWTFLPLPLACDARWHESSVIQKCFGLKFQVANKHAATITAKSAWHYKFHVMPNMFTSWLQEHCTFLQRLRHWYIINLISHVCSQQGFFKENVTNPVWICRDPISLILGTQFSLILGTRFEIVGTRIGSLKRLKKPWFTTILKQTSESM